MRSSVLAGEVVTEVDHLGAKQRTFVHAGGEVMAIQNTDGQSVVWQHYDASRASYRPTTTLGTSLGKEMDPFGADAGVMKPFTWPTTSDSGKIEPFYGVPELNSATQGCVLDRIPVPCDMLANLKEAGGVLNQTLVRDEDGFWRYERESYESHGLGLFTTRPYQVVELGNGQGYPSKEAWEKVQKVQQATKDCVTELWGGKVELEYLIFSRKGHSGSATIKYGESHGTSAQIKNNATRWSLVGLAMVYKGITGEIYPENVKPQISGLTGNGSFHWVDMNGLGDQWVTLTPYENYTANDIDTALPQSDVMDNWQVTQIHELGNSIAHIVKKTVGGGSGDQDSGQQLEECVNKKLGGRP